MNKRGDWSWSFHGIWQPDVQGKLRAFSKRAKHEAIWNQRLVETTNAAVHVLPHLKERVEFNRAIVDPDQPNSNGQSKIADAIHNECFLTSGSGGWFFVVVADQQVTGQTNAFPA